MIPLSPAAKLQMIIDLLHGIPEYNEDGDLIGYSEPNLITIEQARKLLEISDE